jgi:hypothetical protein
MSPPKPAHPVGELDPHAPVVIPTGPDGPKYPLATADILKSLPSTMGVPPPGSIVANTLSDFASVDQSLVYPHGAAKEMTHAVLIAPGTFRHYMRHRGDPQHGGWFDGDRNNDNNTIKHENKSRSEMSGLLKAQGKEMKIGESWEIGTTVWLDPNFIPGGGYCSLMQCVLFQSMITLTAIEGNNVKAELLVMPDGIGGNQSTVHQFKIPRATWTSIAVRVSLKKGGTYAISVNGGSYVTSKPMDLTKLQHKADTKFGPYTNGTLSCIYWPKHLPLNDSQVVYTRIYTKHL